MLFFVHKMLKLLRRVTIFRLPSNVCIWWDFKKCTTNTRQKYLNSTYFITFRCCDYTSTQSHFILLKKISNQKHIYFEYNTTKEIC